MKGDVDLLDRAQEMAAIHKRIREIVEIGAGFALMGTSLALLVVVRSTSRWRSGGRQWRGSAWPGSLHE